jgi:limonene-1,2-epoxide hydrolase
MRSAVIALSAIALVGCGGAAGPSPESVVRAWSAALDRNDNEAAGRLFASGATIVQGGSIHLETHADAVRWNAELPCGGRIESLHRRAGGDVIAIFTLVQRPQHRCDAPGTKAAALFTVRGGKIVLWHQTDVPPPSAGGQLI